MLFQKILNTLPTVEHLDGLDVVNSTGDIVHHIANKPGQFGSLRVYHALYLQSDGVLSTAEAMVGLQLFGEHTENAKQHPGQHPNIDLLLNIIANHHDYRLVLLEK